MMQPLCSTMMENEPISKSSSDHAPIHMTEGQARKVHRLVKKQCCNYYAGDCILLDCPCPHLITRSLICKWFRDAILPSDSLLLHEVMRIQGSHRLCVICKAPYIPSGNRNKYCPSCAKHVRRQKQREYMRHKRAQC